MGFISHVRRESDAIIFKVRDRFAGYLENLKHPLLELVFMIYSGASLLKCAGDVAVKAKPVGRTRRRSHDNQIVANDIKQL